MVLSGIHSISFGRAEAVSNISSCTRKTEILPSDGSGLPSEGYYNPNSPREHLLLDSASQTFFSQAELLSCVGGCGGKIAQFTLWAHKKASQFCHSSNTQSLVCYRYRKRCSPPSLCVGKTVPMGYRPCGCYIKLLRPPRQCGIAYLRTIP